MTDTPKPDPYLTCKHPKLIAGLDHFYCPDCKVGFAPRSEVYQQAVAAKPRPQRKKQK